MLDLIIHMVSEFSSGLLAATSESLHWYIVTSTVRPKERPSELCTFLLLIAIHLNEDICKLLPHVPHGLILALTIGKVFQGCVLCEERRILSEAVRVYITTFKQCTSCFSRRAYGAMKCGNTSMLQWLEVRPLSRAILSMGTPVFVRTGLFHVFHNQNNGRPLAARKQILQLHPMITTREAATIGTSTAIPKHVTFSAYCSTPNEDRPGCLRPA